MTNDNELPTVRKLSGHSTELRQSAEIYYSQEESSYVVIATLSTRQPSWDLWDESHPWSTPMAGGDTLREITTSFASLADAEQWAYDVFSEWPKTLEEWQAWQAMRAKEQAETKQANMAIIAEREAWAARCEEERSKGSVKIVRYAATDGKGVAQKEFVGAEAMEQAVSFCVAHNTPNDLRYGEWRIEGGIVSPLEQSAADDYDSAFETRLQDLK